MNCSKGIFFHKCLSEWYLGVGLTLAGMDIDGQDNVRLWKCPGEGKKGGVS